MDLKTIRLTVHNRMLRLRSLDRLVESKQFEAAYSIDPDSVELQDALDNEAPDALESWINRTLKKRLDDLSLRELRTKASKYKIAFYTTFSKPDLILKILEAQNAREVQESTTGVSPAKPRHNAEHATRIGCEVSVPESIGRNDPLSARVGPGCSGGSSSLSNPAS